jgi:hypothetical protein
VLISRSGDDPEPAPTPDPVARVVVPDVVGSPTSVARTALEAAGLVVEVAVVDTMPAQDSCDRPVLISVPRAGAEVDAGATVTLGVPPRSPLILCANDPRLFFTDMFTFELFTQ